MLRRSAGVFETVLHATPAPGAGVGVLALAMIHEPSASLPAAAGSAASDTVLFWVFFALTLAGLGTALWMGLRRRRRAHLRFAPVALVLLGVTIFFAERMGRARVFPAEQMRIHLWFAKSAALLVLPVLASGIVLARRPGPAPRARRAHRVCVALFLLAAVVATGTGIWVFSLSRPQ